MLNYLLRIRWLIPVLFSISLCACDRQPIQFSGKTMGSAYHITVVDLPETKNPESVEKDIAALLADADKRMTTYNPDSELNRFNAAPVGEWQRVSPLLYNAFIVSLNIAKASDGAFEPTILPLVILWGFGSGQHHDLVPAESEIAGFKKQIGYQFIELDNADTLRVRKIREVKVDLSGMGHGYGADLVAEYLDRQGVNNYLAEVAGEMRIKGHRYNGEPWRVAIENPADENPAIKKPGDSGSDVFAALHLTHNIGIATSGDYRNYFFQGGVRYSHTIDPETGRPVRHALASVTVLDPSAARADALATAILVMGPEKGKLFAEINDIPVYFIVREGSLFRGFFSKAFKSFDINNKN